MIAGARPLFEHLPVDFADPVALAAQQADGRLSLIVVAYPAAEDTAALPAVYDVFVCRAPLIVTVAHMTSEFRFPVPVARAMQRFATARTRGLPATVSCYELDRPDLTRFLESVYFQECLKLFVRDADERPRPGLLAAEIRRTGCRAGVLEVNDFSDPMRPRLALLDVEKTDAAKVGKTVGRLARRYAGRVLIYDRLRNRSVAADRGAGTLDPEAVLAQSLRFAERLHGRTDDALRPALAAQEALSTTRAQDEAQVDTFLASAAGDAETDEERHLNDALAALLTGQPGDLLAEESLSPDAGDGVPPDPLAALFGPTPSSIEAPPSCHPELDLGSPEETQAGDEPAAPAPPEEAIVAHGAEAVDAEAAAVRDELPARYPAQVGTANVEAAIQAAVHGLVRTVQQEMQQHLSESRADVLTRQAAEAAGVALPIGPADALAFLGALVGCQPPRRWIGARRRMAGLRTLIAADLHAVHAQYRHHPDHPLLFDIARLWSRCTY